MSLLLPRRLLVSLGAEQFAMILQTSFTKRIQVKHQANFATASEQPWKASLQQLEQQLEALKLPINTPLSITLASDLVRYLILPSQQVAMSASEKNGYAQAAFREVYGSIAESWRISLDDVPPNQPMLACAIDQSFYEALEKLANKYQLKTNTLQPYLMTTYNRLFPHIQGSNATLVVIEPSRMLVVNLQKGVCKQVRCEKYGSDWQVVLQQMLSRDVLLTDNPSKELMLYAPAHKNATFSLSQDWSLARLGAAIKHNVNHPAYAMLEALQ